MRPPTSAASTDEGASNSTHGHEGPAPVTHDSADCRLAEAVERALRGAGYAALRGVAVTARARVVTLGGQVSTYHLKQIAQAAALRVEGVGRVQNHIKVR